MFKNLMKRIFREPAKKYPKPEGYHNFDNAKRSARGKWWTFKKKAMNADPVLYFIQMDKETGHWALIKCASGKDHTELWKDIKRIVKENK